MARRKAPADQPDAVVHAPDGERWGVFCTLCPRELGVMFLDRDAAHGRAREHLATCHGLHRIWVGQDRPGYREAVQAALPLIVAHDLTLQTDRRAR